MQATYELQRPLTREDFRALASLSNLYGLNNFNVEEKTGRLTLDYDASRLREAQVESALRHARIPVLRRVSN